MSKSPDQPLSVVVLISGNGSNLQAIIDAIATGSVPARVVAVISNRAEAYGLTRAANAGIPQHVLNHRNYADRDAYDAEMMALIDRYAPGLVVLAGFMRILSDGFVAHYAGRMMNIHPSLLPRYRGLNTHQRVLQAGDAVHGASVHFVTPELDAGPVIVQAAVPVQPGDDADALAARVHTREHLIYPLAIRWFAEGRVRLEDDTVLYDGHPISDDERMYRADPATHEAGSGV
ncbi:MAG: phosphoribosylglycinamide formyltransferase [Pseudomonadota bacterium]|nr:MAG: phosphoribosylglycinamide formyltransferase [Pseudomonadota bacterium]